MISVGASIASGCKLCTELHVKDARRCGATDEEIKLAMTDALRVRRDAEEMMERHGLRVLGRELLRSDSTDRDEGADSPPGVSPTRIGELVAVAAAFAVNCETSLAQHVAAGSEGLHHRQFVVRRVLVPAGGNAAHVGMRRFDHFLERSE